jgi:hypothetical protein
MESNRILIGALLFILIVVGSNYVMFVIARNWAKGGDSRWMTAIKDSLSKPLDSKSNQSMDELRKQIAQLEQGKKEDQG